MFSGWDTLILHLQERESFTAEHEIRDIATYPTDDSVNVLITTPRGQGVASLNDWSLGLLCSKAKAPKAYINALTPQLASDCINHSLSKREDRGKGFVGNILQTDDGPLARAFYSQGYARVPDLEMAQFYHRMATEFNYEPAGTFAGKRGGMPPVNPKASGLYHGERNQFLFIANEDGAVEIDGGSVLYHCVMAWNSEVTASQIGFSHCLYNFICGNHMIWGMQEYREVSARHVGHPEEVLHKAQDMFIHIDRRRSDLQTQIHTNVREAQRKEFGATREQVKKKLETYMTRKDAGNVLDWSDHPKAYPKAPNTVWGVAQGVTLYSQTFKNADNRRSMDKVAQNILEKVEITQ
jgi:hypothetical protein